MKAEMTYSEAYDRGLRNASERTPANPPTYMTAKQRRGWWDGYSDGLERRRAEAEKEAPQP